jgi:hypothetical protein
VICVSDVLETLAGCIEKVKRRVESVDYFSVNSIVFPASYDYEIFGSIYTFVKPGLMSMDAHLLTWFKMIPK